MSHARSSSSKVAEAFAKDKSRDSKAAAITIRSRPPEPELSAEENKFITDAKEVCSTIIRDADTFESTPELKQDVDAARSWLTYIDTAALDGDPANLRPVIESIKSDAKFNDLKELAVYFKENSEVPVKFTMLDNQSDDESENTPKPQK